MPCHMASHLCTTEDTEESDQNACLSRPIRLIPFLHNRFISNFLIHKQGRLYIRLHTCAAWWRVFLVFCCFCPRPLFTWQSSCYNDIMSNADIPPLIKLFNEHGFLLHARQFAMSLTILNLFHAVINFVLPNLFIKIKILSFFYLHKPVQ